MIYIAPKS